MKRIEENPRGIHLSNPLKRLSNGKVQGRISEVNQLIARVLTDRFHPSKVLDIGCGAGGLVHAFHTLGADAYGVDISETAVLQAAKIITGRVQILDVDCQPLPFETRRFDLITAIMVLQHLQRPGRIISEIWRVLHPGGITVVFVPLIPFESALWQVLKMSRDLEHINNRSKSTWIRVFELNGFL